MKVEAHVSCARVWVVAAPIGCRGEDGRVAWGGVAEPVERGRDIITQETANSAPLLQPGEPSPLESGRMMVACAVSHSRLQVVRNRVVEWCLAVQRRGLTK
jgi:hypothetical protein